MEKAEIIKLADEYMAKELDEGFKNQVKKLLEEENFTELEDCFYKNLDFGTGGIRGVIGGGYNRMNPYIIRKVTQGLATYINKSAETLKQVQGDALWQPSVVLAHDSRRCSRLFAETAAAVFCGNGIKTYLFTSLRPTPELSFAVRHLGCISGVVVTASHNPAEYNGYKVYWDDGGQVVPPQDAGIIAEVNSVKDIKSMDLAEAGKKGLFQLIDKEVDEPFLAMVKGCALRPELIKKEGKKLKVVYTPLHGAGRVWVEKALRDLGIEVLTVPEQAEPDGEFPTVKFPNPEEGSALAMALELGKKTKASLVVGTDPDSDRLGTAVPDGDGFKLITGNQLGCMFIYYVLSTLKEQGKLTPDTAIIKTVVTTELQRRIGESFGVRVYDVLTGFKNIASLMKIFESTGEKFVYGGEESYGYLFSTDVRDKDGVAAAVMACEMTLYNSERGMSLLDYLDEIYEKFGYFQESPFSFTFKGSSGGAKIKKIMEDLRSNLPKSIGGIAVASSTDFKDGVVKQGVKLPPSNVLQFVLADGSYVTARPSGTEPKIKFYISCCEKAGMMLEEAKKKVGAKCQAIKEDLEKILGV